MFLKVNYCSFGAKVYSFKVKDCKAEKNTILYVWKDKLNKFNALINLVIL